MVEIKDFSDWNVYDGASEGSGRSEKVWLISSKGVVGLFKFPKIDPAVEQTTTEHISEHLAYQLGLLLNVKTATVDIGVYKGRIGSMSYLLNTPSEALIEGVNFISRMFPRYNVDLMMDEDTGLYYNVDHIFKSTERLIPPEEWIEMMLFDFLIGNSDRHQSNWAIIGSFADPEKTKLSIRRCPLYDNGSSLCCYVNDAQLSAMLGRDQRPFDSLCDSKSRSTIRIDGTVKRPPSHKEVIRYLIKRYPITVSYINYFTSTLNTGEIVRLLGEYPGTLLNTQKKLLIQRFLERKVDILQCLVEEANHHDDESKA